MADPIGGRRKLSILIVHFNTPHLLTELFRTIDQASSAIDAEIIFVDNASSENCEELVRSLCPPVRFIRNERNIGFGRANNQALQWASGEFVLLLNTDAFIAPNALRDSLAYMDLHPLCGVLGARLVGRDGHPQPSCRSFPTPWNVFVQALALGRLFPGAKAIDETACDQMSASECDWVPGCFYLIRRAVLQDVGLFDPKYFLYFEEVDHCKAVKQAGWLVVCLSKVSVIHLGGESALSSGTLTSQGRQLSDLAVESQLLYFRKHFGLFGALTNALLELVVQIYRAVVGLIRRRQWAGVPEAARNVVKVIRALLLTKFGTKATR